MAWLGYLELGMWSGTGHAGGTESQEKASAQRGHERPDTTRHDQVPAGDMAFWLSWHLVQDSVCVA